MIPGWIQACVCVPQRDTGLKCDVSGFSVCGLCRVHVSACATHIVSKQINQFCECEFSLLLLCLAAALLNLELMDEHQRQNKRVLSIVFN